MMTKSLETLLTDLTAMRDIVPASEAFVMGLRQAIIDAGTEPAHLKALTDALQDPPARWSNALIANTQHDTRNRPWTKGDPLPPSDIAGDPQDYPSAQDSSDAARRRAERAEQGETGLPTSHTQRSPRKP